MILGFFPYQALHYKAAQAYLDKKAARGLELQKVCLGCIAVFQKADHPSHFVDLNLKKFNERGTHDDIDPDYLALCADAGWELVRELRGMLLFRAEPGKAPLPIQTDGDIEWDRFWERSRPRLASVLILLASLALLAVTVLCIPPQGWELTPLLTSNISLLLLLYWTLALVFSLLTDGEYRLYLARCKKTGRVEQPGKLAILVDSFEQLRRWVAFPLIALVLITPFLHPAVQLRSNLYEEEKTATAATCGEYPTLRACDLGFADDTDEAYSRYLTGNRSLLCEYYEYSELTRGEETYILTTEYYDCTWEFLAKWAFDRRANETRNGSFLWGDLDWKEAPGLGFDESLTCQNGAYLLLREGKLVALVGCTDIDLTTPENLSVIRTRLGLPLA